MKISESKKQIKAPALLFISLLTATPVKAVTDLSLSSTPLFLNSVPPNVMVMLDNSGSMKVQMYTGNYNNSTDYYGIFEATKNYEYDNTIPVNTGAYLTTVNANDTGAFIESTCTPSAVNEACWSGRYLNWLTTKRIDSSRMVLVGGKLESTTAFNYGTNLNYKIVGNNEHADRVFTEASSISSDYSPIPNNVAAIVDSPARINNGNILASYSPYATIKAGAGGRIYDSSGGAVGEFGAVDITGQVDGSGELTDASWVTVTLQGSYSNTPAIVAAPPTRNGGDPVVIRIRNASNNSFQINIQEWDYKDGNHTQETVNYLVVENGHHFLDGGIELDADIVNTNKENASYSSDVVNESTTVNFNNTLTSPVVISSIISYNDLTAVASRVWDVSNSGFKLAMQEQETLGGNHSPENIAYIAIDQGSVTDNTNTPNWSLQSSRITNVTHSQKTITFASTFATPPYFIAGIQSLNGADPSTLRLRSRSASNVKINIEEEKSNDNETDHTEETVGYIALQGLSSTYNVALVVEDKPSGLLHDIESKVRLGISFYRFNPDVNNIYNGNTIQGGTLKFKIPLNPFVKKPTNSSLPLAERGYRELTGYIGSTIDDVSDAIQNYPLVWGTTPLAENLWEVIQYFEQDDPHYPDVVSGYKDFDKGVGTVRDPYYYSDYDAKLECAKSNVIIFTDGEPYKDADIPTSIVDYDDDSKVNDLASTNVSTQGKDNLDDVAYWGYCDKSTGACDTSTGGSRDLRSDIDNLVDGNGNDIPQFLKAYTVGFAGGNIKPILQDTADNAGGVAYAAQDGDALRLALDQAFSAIISDSSSSSVAVTTGSLNAKSAIFQPSFNSNDWSGKLSAFPVNSDGSLGGKVIASKIPDASSRKIITYNGSQGIAFQWPSDPANPTSSDMTVAQLSLLPTIVDANDPSINNSEDVFNYIRGSDALEEENGGTFRDRENVLGDIIHSSPIYVDATIEALFPDNWGTGALENAQPFSAYKSTIAALNSGQGRTPMIYVGANDGMLHAFNAKIEADSNNDGVPEFPSAFGNEQFAYIPNITFSKLKGLTVPNLAHQYSVDGSPTVGNAFFNSAWHTVLVAGLRGGGQGLYALDVTYPSDYNSEAGGAAKVLWEFTDNDDNSDDSDGNVGEKGDNDLGYTFSRPNIVRMQNGVWAAVFGNGYNNTETDTSISTTGNAVLYIVNLQTGALIKKIDTGVGFSDSASGGKPNGLATVAPVDLDGDLIVDYVYAGDLYGNLWKFDLSVADTANWEVSFSGSPLFTACSAATCTSSNRQPITVRPQIGKKEYGSGYLVYFGTGKYIETTDNTQASQTTQSFYAVWDKHETTLTTFDRSDMLQQEIITEFNQGFDSDGDSNTGDGNGFDDFFGVRISTNNELRIETDNDGNPPHLGWYINLITTDNSVNPDSKNFGERQVSHPVLRNGRIIFTTLIPSDDPCENGGSGWLMEFDAADGARLPYSPFDLDGDGEFDSDDFVDGGEETGRIAVSGKKSKVGIILTPTILDDDDKEYKYNNGSSGSIEVTRENPGLNFTGRQSWIQLENE